MNLRALGWDQARETEFAPLRASGLEPARVATEDKHHFGVLTDNGDYLVARVPGRFQHRVKRSSEFPKVGDWVAVSRVPGEEKALVEQVLARRTWLSRKEAGREVEEQLLVTNVDVVFIVQPLDDQFKPGLMQRQLVMAREGGAQPLILLNKADLCPDVEQRQAVANEMSGGAPVLVVSAKTRRGLPQLRDWLKPTQTVVFIGASGVGKSSLINRLYGDEVQATTEVRESDAKGRHTTTWREMIALPSGALVIDTPGMRELQMWLADEGVHEAFPDIEELATRCHFRDCSHSHEKRCAVQEALASGQLARDRYERFLRLQRELAFLEQAQVRRGYTERKRAMRVAQRAFNKQK
jgi:ribosome biogenesis GTPase